MNSTCSRIASAATPWTLISSRRDPLCVDKRSSSFPEAASLPLRKIATSSQRASMSESMWVDMKTVVPFSRSPAISSRISRRPTGSSPLIGSSRKTISGSLINDWARPTRWSMPLEYLRSWRFQSCSCRPTAVSNSVVFIFRVALS